MSFTLSPEALLEALHWRYATRKFDAARKIAAADWHALEQSLVLAPSSIGLQPWRFFVVTDAAVKERLMAAAWRQVQVVDCSHFVVFAVRRNLGADHVARHVARMAEVRGLPIESLAKFRDMAVGNLDQARAEGRLDKWQEHQLYIALGQFLASAAVLGIDTCPMEGFEPAKFDEILGLKGTEFASVVACAAGYRVPDERYALMKKVRFRTEDVIVRV
ncbi:NAD(P)H-dependent oxidoreductase [Opitutus sp. ER46]|uniref:NAD(P)H-dependent oxidoreductase n=1 Tax=Opitutus sp. ER46 TaxID=2161864 RepID=UPI000D3111D0|nr:NAD(P)H-dependent oxidoreductase [Opitutus sp. ER46]PTX91289.1 NAD(P)H-dependent oxidoreductase [Opitutus sp. ER46]